MLPSGWKLTTLGEVCRGKLQTGPFGSQLHSHEYVENGVAVIMPKDLINCRVVLEFAAKIPEEKAYELKKHQLTKGDLIFSRRGDVARFALIDEISEGSLCGTGCLKATPNQRHSPLFLSYFLQKDSIRQWLESNAVGQTMPNMNTEILRELPLISASSRDEEDKIAQILSTWDKAITTTEQLIANSQQQKKALMQQLLTGKKRLLDNNGVRFSGEWIEAKLGTLVDITSGESKSKFVSEHGQNYIIDMGSVSREGKLIPSKKTNLEEDYLDANQLVMPKDDIGGGNIIGRVGLIPESEKFILGDHVYALTVNGCDSQFLSYLINSFPINKSLRRKANGTAQLGLGKKDVQKQPVNIPDSLVEQQKIASVLSSVDQEIELLQSKLSALKQEKKALMQQLLTGKRRVKVD